MTNKNLEQTVMTSGEWQKVRIGGTRAISYDEQYTLYKRTRTLNEITNNRLNGEKDINSSDTPYKENKSNKDKNIDQNGKKSMLTNSQKEPKTDGFKSSYGNPIEFYEPTCDYNIDSIANAFDEFESLKAMRSENDSLVIGVSVTFRDGIGCNPVCYCFSVFQHGIVLEYCFVKKNFDDTDLISLCMCLGRILDDLGIERVRCEDALQYKYIPSLNDRNGNPVVCVCDSLNEVHKRGIYAFINNSATNVVYREGDVDSNGNKHKLYLRSYDNDNFTRCNITLLGFDILYFLSAVERTNSNDYDFTNTLCSAGGGLFSTRNIKMHAKSVYPSCAWNYCYLINMSVRDCKCSVPADFDDISSLCDVLNVSVVSLSENDKLNMNTVFNKDIDLFLDYSSMHSLLPLLYTSYLYGFNKEQPRTLLSVSADLMHRLICNYFNVANDDDYNRVYRGWYRRNRGKMKDESSLALNDVTSLEAINRDALVLQSDACESYCGGVNGSYEIGCFDNVITYDYDLRNAYPTSMCLVPDIDWENCILEEFEPDHILTIDDFRNENGETDVFAPLFGYVSFRFPDSVLFHCIPIANNGNLVFPRSSDVLAGIFVLGPDLYAALVLGACIKVQRGYKIRTLKTSSGEVSYSLRSCTKQFVVDRSKAREKFGKNSIVEITLKLMINGNYGKIAQNIVQKHRWSAATDKIENSNCSIITNPFSAAMTTSIIRATLLCTLNEVCKNGYSVYSCTTDGFISDIPFDKLSNLELYGIRERLSQIRNYLTDNASDEIWEVKHIQNDLLNFSTRGNVSLNIGSPDFIHPDVNDYDKLKQYRNLAGVCAHCGLISPFAKDSYEDRLWLITQVFSRTDAVKHISRERTPFKKFVHGYQIRIYEIPESIHVDYDMKRKPIIDSFYTTYRIIDGVTYELENFKTEPFESIDEMQKYRSVKESVKCLRTKADWKIFWQKINVNKSNVKIRDIEGSVLNSVVMGHRAEKWRIGILDSDKLTVAEKCDWINKFNKSKHTFKISDWKNARKAERQSSILDHELLEPLLTEMQAASDVDMKNLK